MAKDISTIFSIIDNTTKQIKSIAKSVKGLTSGFSKLHSAINRVENSKFTKLNKSAEDISKAMKGIGKIEISTEPLETANSSVIALKENMNGLSTVINSMGSFSFGNITNATQNFGESLTELSNILSNLGTVELSTKDFEKSQTLVKMLAQDMATLKNSMFTMGNTGTFSQNFAEMNDTALRFRNNIVSLTNLMLGFGNIQLISEEFAKTSSVTQILIEDMENLGSTMKDLGSVDLPNQEFEEINTAIENSSSSMLTFTQRLKNAWNSGNKLKNIFSVIKEQIKGIADIGGLLYISKSIYNSVSNTINKFISLSDSITQTTARLDLMNDGLQTTSELWNKIKASADSSRASLLNTASIIASLGQRTNGVFANNDEVIKFSETLNKMFAIAGASIEEMNSATLQLTQALGSGVLRGEELNAVFEAAPNVIQTIADYLGVGIGQIRNMASEGMITADVVKNAMFSAVDSVNKQFESMPMTFSQVFTLFKNDLIDAFSPISDALSEIANNSSLKSFFSFISTSVSSIAPLISSLIKLVSRFFQALWETIQPMANFVLGFIDSFTSSLSGATPYLEAFAVALGVVTGAILTYRTAVTLAKVAQWAFNTSIYACPLSWLAVGIGAVIGLIIGLRSGFLKLTGAVGSFGEGVITTVGEILGAVSFLAVTIVDLFLAAFNTVKLAFNSVIWGIVEGVNLIAKLIDKLGFTNFSATTSIWADKWENKAKSSIDNWGKGMSDPLEVFHSTKDWFVNLFTKSEDMYKDTNTVFSLDDYTLDTLDSIASDTSSISNSLKSLNDEVKYISDIAERRYINNYSNVVRGDKIININIQEANNTDKILNAVKKAIADDINSNANGVYSY